MVVPLKTVSEKLEKEETLLDCWNGSWSKALAMLDIRIMAKLGGVTHWAKPIEKSGDIE